LLISASELRIGTARKFARMTKKILFFICPDCHLESTLVQKYGQDIYFLTALGSVFDLSDTSFIHDLDSLVERELISEIVIINDSCCTFLTNTVLPKAGYSTKVEEVLKKLFHHNADRFEYLKTDKKLELLAKLNTYRQLYEFFDVPLLGKKIEKGLINVRGLVYDRSNKTFNNVSFNS
jgi:carbonic anhydrase